MRYNVMRNNEGLRGIILSLHAESEREAIDKFAALKVFSPPASRLTYEFKATTTLTNAITPQEIIVPQA
jgi:hypothetical protein